MIKLIRYFLSTLNLQVTVAKFNTQVTEYFPNYFLLFSKIRLEYKLRYFLRIYQILSYNLPVTHLKFTGTFLKFTSNLWKSFCIKWLPLNLFYTFPRLTRYFPRTLNKYSGFFCIKKHTRL